MLDATHLSLSQAGLVFDSRSGDSYQINDSASLIIKLFQSHKSAEDVAEALAKTYNLNKEQALSDILEFQTQLSIIGLI